MPIMTEADTQMLPLALRANQGFHIATEWYLRGWKPQWYQYLFHQTNVPNTTFIAGIACVHGDTKVLDPITGAEAAIADLATSGKPITVLSWAGDHFAIAKASPPFRKGRADLYRVKLEDGRQIVTTAEHRFLTPSGYVALKELRAGSLVGALPNVDLPIPASGERHCSRTAQDCQDHCPLYPRLCGGQPLPAADNVRASFPLRGDVGGYTHAGLFRDDHRKLLLECTHPEGNASTDVLFVQVADISFEEAGDFYDMHVPLYENYVANGIVNHNTGKTTGVAASTLMDCLTIPFFRALNTSVTAKQAELPFEMIQPWIEANPRLEHLIEDISLRPYPTIKFKNFSEYIFRTAGKDARFIRGMEFDRINYDEAGLDPTGETVKVLRGRLRGVRPDGTKRMDRLDVTTSPTAAAWLRERFERGWKGNPEANLLDYLSLRIATYDNKALTPHTIELMEQEYSDDMIDVELRGMFPEYGITLFPQAHVIACTDVSLNDAMEMALRPEKGRPKPGWRNEEHPRYGITLFEMPYEPSHVYVMGGDPGTDGPPRRNSPAIFVLDVTERPRKVVYFHWLDGKGSYNPFLASYKYAIQKYHPILKGIDATGTQKAIDELAFENYGIGVDALAFNRDKDAMINTTIQMIADHELCWPVIKGLQRQLGSYTRDDDKKIPQDLVMALAEVAFLSRFVGEAAAEQDVHSTANRFANRKKRTSVRRRR